MCYYLKTLYFNDPIFDSVDATYIIHLEGNGRYSDIEEQLEKYHPSKIVHILFNKGFKRCEKKNIDSSPKDIIDANLYIFKHATKYDTILVLEDDFMFDSKIKEHSKNIDSFVNNHSHFIYRIGCIPCIMVPYNLHTYRGISGGAHCVLYSKSIRHEIQNMNPLDIDDWDFFTTTRLFVNFIYYKPLCYQLFPATENQSNWGRGNDFYIFMSKLIIVLLKFLLLDKHIEPGYSIMYANSKLWWIIVIIIIFIIFKNMRILGKKQKMV